MNNDRRKILDEAINDLRSVSERLEQIRFNIDDIKDQEDSARNDLPESLEFSEKANKMNEAVYQLEDACNQLELIDFNEIISCIEIAKE